MKNFPRNQVTHYDTFDAFMEGIEKEFGDRPAISWFLRNKTEMCRSFRETAEDVRQLKEALYHRGLAGKNIALVGENSYDWIITYLAVAASRRNCGMHRRGTGGRQHLADDADGRGRICLRCLPSHL